MKGEDGLGDGTEGRRWRGRGVGKSMRERVNEGGEKEEKVAENREDREKGKRRGLKPGRAKEKNMVNIEQKER